MLTSGLNINLSLVLGLAQSSFMILLNELDQCDKLIIIGPIQY